MAWINTIPSGENKPRHKVLKNIKYPAQTNRQYLLDYFTILLRGSDQITFTELSNFSQMMGISLTPLESTTLVEMGSVYRTFKQVAADPRCENPLMTPQEKVKQKMLSIRSHMKSIKIRKGRKRHG